MSDELIETLYNDLVELANEISRDEDNYADQEILDQFVRFCEKRAVNYEYPYGFNQNDPTIIFYLKWNIKIKFENKNQSEEPVIITVSRG